MDKTDIGYGRTGDKIMGYFGTGTKEEILANLDTVLRTISGIKFVDYQKIRASGASVDKYPGIFINDAATDKERLLKDLVRNIFGVQLVCWVWAKADEDLITKQNVFMETIKDKVMADPTRGSKAYDTVIENVTTDAGSRHPQGQAIVNMAIIFYSEE